MTEARDVAIQHKNLVQEQQLAAVLATPEGRAVIWRILEETGTFHDTPPKQKGRAIGRRQVGLRLLSWVYAFGVGPFRKMQDEAMAFHEELQALQINVEETEDEY